MLIPKGKQHGRKALAYSLEEVSQHLDLVSRGLATNLSRLGVFDMVIQGILRHENVSTAHRYINRVSTDATDAMNKLAAEIAGSAVVPQPDRSC